MEAGVRGRAAGFFQAGFLIGGITGPAVGGCLGGDIAHRTVLLLPRGRLRSRERSVWCCCAAAVRSPRSETADSTVSYSRRRTRRSLPGCVLNQPRSKAGPRSESRSSLVPVLVVELLHRPASWTGIAFACASVVQTIAVGPAGRFTDTVGRRPAMILGGTVAAVSIMAVPFAPNIWLLIIVLCVYGVASAFLGTAPAAAVGDAAGSRGGTAVAALLDVLGHRGDHRTAGRGPAGGHVVVSGRLRGRCGADAPGGWTVVADATGAAQLGRSGGGAGLRASPPKGRCMSPRPLSELVSPDWADALQPVAATITAMGAFLRAELAAGRQYLPAGEHVLRAFSRPLEPGKDLDRGTRSVSHARASGGSVVLGGIRTYGPSRGRLQNIYAELQADLGIRPAASGDLTPWFAARCAAAQPSADRATGALGITPRQGLGAGDAAGNRGAGRLGAVRWSRSCGDGTPNHSIRCWLRPPRGGRSSTRRCPPPAGFFGVTSFSRAK